MKNFVIFVLMIASFGGCSREKASISEEHAQIAEWSAKISQVGMALKNYSNRSSPDGKPFRGKISELYAYRSADQIGPLKSLDDWKDFENNVIIVKSDDVKYIDLILRKSIPLGNDVISITLDVNGLVEIKKITPNNQD